MIREAYHDLLYLGDAISARDPKQIYDHRLEAVMDLAINEPPAVLGRDIIYCRFPLSDDGSNEDVLVSTAIECLCSLLKRHRTLVACSAGMSRSPVIAASAISILSGEPLKESLQRIAAKTPHDVSPTFFSSVQRVCDQLADS